MDPSSRTGDWPPSVLNLRGLWYLYYIPGFCLYNYKHIHFRHRTEHWLSMSYIFTVYLRWFRLRLIFAVFGRRLISPLHSFINLEVFFKLNCCYSSMAVSVEGNIFKMHLLAILFNLNSTGKTLKYITNSWQLYFWILYYNIIFNFYRR